MYIYYRKNGTVAMRSEKKIQTDLEYIKIKPKKDELEKIEQNYKMTVNKKKLEFEEPEYIKKISIEEMKESVLNADTLEDLKPILNQLLNKM